MMLKTWRSFDSTVMGHYQSEPVSPSDMVKVRVPALLPTRVLYALQFGNAEAAKG
jgi:hypothetical protein